MRVRLTKRGNREIAPEFAPDKKHLKTISNILKTTAGCLGGLTNAAASFNKLKSADVSCDGKLGGKGFVRDITDLRKAFFEACDKVSDIYDCLYDETKAPHWSSKPKEIEEEIEEIKEVKDDNGDQFEYLIDKVEKENNPVDVEEDKFNKDDDKDEKKKDKFKLEEHIG